MEVFHKELRPVAPLLRAPCLPANSPIRIRRRAWQSNHFVDANKKVAILRSDPPFVDPAAASPWNELLISGEGYPPVGFVPLVRGATAGKHWKPTA